MISKELEQEFNKKGIELVFREKAIILIRKDNGYVVSRAFIVENNELVISIYSQELKQAELIIKLAKEWQK